MSSLFLEANLKVVKEIKSKKLEANKGINRIHLKRRILLDIFLLFSYAQQKIMFLEKE